MKKISYQLVLFLFIFSLSLCCYAYDFEENGIYYTFNGKNVEVTYNKYNDYSGDIVIPSIVTYESKEYIVKSIGYEAFKNCTLLKSIQLPETITRIDNNAFQGCVLLQSIELPVNTTSLGYEAFKGCVSLEYINLGKNIEELHNYVFSGCISLRQLSIPSCVKRLEYYTFMDCNNLSVITFEDGEDELEIKCTSSPGNFSETSLDSMYLGRNLKYENGSPFIDNNTLRSVYISNSVKKINDYLFKNASNLKRVEGMENVTYIGYSAFEGTSITSFVVKDNVKEIGTYAFSSCKLLKDLIIGNGITSLGKDNYNDNGNVYIINGCDIENLYIGNNIKSLKRNSFDANFIRNVYIFSNQISEVYSNTIIYPDEFVFTKSANVYVADIERYKNLLGSLYDLKSLLIFNENSLEYSGITPNLTYRNFAENTTISFDEASTPKDVASYNTMIDVNFHYDDWTTTTKIPCTYAITKAPLTIKAKNYQIQYGDSIPTLEFTIFGLKNNEDVNVLETQPKILTEASLNSDAGKYEIIISGANAKNYDIKYENGVLLINKAEQAIIWEQTFEDQAPGCKIELNAYSTSGLPLSFETTDPTTAFVSKEKDKYYAYFIKEGYVMITARQNGNNNYEAAESVNQVFHILPTGINNIHNNTQNISNRKYLNKNKIVIKTGNSSYNLDGRINKGVNIQ